ncbi:hypothetical protein B0H19DRAFT_1241186 [Mycena capillaripes]|nr:hypothetical protein B0H19DRAFT_1241186 [Mycena capillaripes]
MSPGSPSARLIIQSIRKIDGSILAKVLLLGKPSAYRSETFIGDPLLHDLPWISEFDFDLVNATELKTLPWPMSPEGRFSGKAKRPAAKTVEKMYKIQWTTLGAIVNSCCLAIWLHSADTQLSEIGDETGINYRERHSYYMQRIVEALVSKKAGAVDLVAYWDRILFPDADKPHANAAGSAGDQPDEDDDDFFGSAPAVVSPARLIRPTTPINTSVSSRDESSTSPAPPARNNHRPPPPQRSHSPTPQPRHSASARSEGVRRRRR